MDEKIEEKPEEEKEQGATDDTDAGDKPEESKAVAKLRAKNERMEKALEKQRELIAEQEELEARTALGGKAEAGMKAPEPKKETDDEYAEKVRLGLANPLKEDGFI